jgi:hypothetical protein
MIALATVKDIFSNLDCATAQLKAWYLIKEIIPALIAKSGLRDAEQIFDFVIESSYELLPFPVRMLVKKEVYIEVAKDNKDKVIAMIIAHN